VESAFHEYMQTHHPDILNEISQTRELSAKTEENLKSALVEFKRLKIE
jgi:F0F1-type ATP synthase alpha subunit